MLMDQDHKLKLLVLLWGNMRKCPTKRQVLAMDDQAGGGGRWWAVVGCAGAIGQLKADKHGSHGATSHATYRRVSGSAALMVARISC
jgi:hypothetical protein